MQQVCCCDRLLLLLARVVCLLLTQVSHDQYLIESTVDELWMCEGGSVTPFHGTFEEYKKRLRSNKAGH